MLIIHEPVRTVESGGCMKIISVAVIGSAALCSSPASAEYCADRPTQVIVQSANNIWFTTHNLCKSWCAIPAEWTEAQRDRAFSVLMTAASQSKNVTLFFDGPCVTQETYAKVQLVAYTSAN